MKFKVEVDTEDMGEIEAPDKAQALKMAREKVSVDTQAIDASITVFYDDEEVENYYDEDYQKIIEENLKRARDSIKVKELSEVV